MHRYNSNYTADEGRWPARPFWPPAQVSPLLGSSRAGGTAAQVDMQASDRYVRQCLLPEIGTEGQQRLARARAVVVGVGALGTVQASLLVRAGVGETVLIDRDIVELSNLQRQCLFLERDADLGTPKAVAAAEALREANSDVSVTAFVNDLTPSNADRLLASADVILDGTDNFEARYLINDVAVKRSIAWIYGAAVGTRGSLMPVVPDRTACLGCLFPSAPRRRQPTCDTEGVLSSATTLVASLQVVEALKVLADRLESLNTRLVSIDAWTGERSSVRADRPEPKCMTCGQRQFLHLESGASPSARLCGRDAVQVPGGDRDLDLAGLAGNLAPLGEVRSSEHAMRFCCPPHELTVFPDGRAIVKGTQDLALARSLYARFVGN